MYVTIDAMCQEIKEVLDQRECLASIDVDCQEEYDARRAFKSPAHSSTQEHSGALSKPQVFKNGTWVSLRGTIDELEAGVEHRVRGVNDQ